MKIDVKDYTTCSLEKQLEWRHQTRTNKHRRQRHGQQSKPNLSIAKFPTTCLLLIQKCWEMMFDHWRWKVTAKFTFHVLTEVEIPSWPPSALANVWATSCASCNTSRRLLRILGWYSPSIQWYFSFHLLKRRCTGNKSRLDLIELITQWGTLDEGAGALIHRASRSGTRWNSKYSNMNHRFYWHTRRPEASISTGSYEPEEIRWCIDKSQCLSISFKFQQRVNTGSTKSYILLLPPFDCLLPIKDSRCGRYSTTLPTLLPSPVLPRPHFRSYFCRCHHPNCVRQHVINRYDRIIGVKRISRYYHTRWGGFLCCVGHCVLCGPHKVSEYCRKWRAWQLRFSSARTIPLQHFFSNDKWAIRIWVWLRHVAYLAYLHFPSIARCANFLSTLWP